MDSTPQPLDKTSFVEIDCRDRWAVYHRLQELGIVCRCEPYQPLTVQVDHPEIAIQLWSVLQVTVQSRSQLTLWLERCWRLCSYRTMG